MIAKLISILRNRPHGKEEERLVASLRSEAASERKRDQASPDNEEGVREIMRLIASEPRPSQTSPSNTPRRFLLPAFGIVSVIAVILFLSNGVLRQGDSVDEIGEQARTPSPSEPVAISVELPIAKLTKGTLQILRDSSKSFPLVKEAASLKQDIGLKADTFLMVAKSWGEFAAPEIPAPTLPEFPETPYQSELKNLRQDARRAIEFLGQTLASFKS